eukprot:CAMPEP_0172485914 /NCGR_PEP_ID=MMETSP1066-20121228/14196_1 /TAXON_ID=671091 /ORGANISM="Coscinodiscus wailesii, Strain CCMP2513" /LENGTH=291 /DNA_ID=CAMNT_0013251493 /DNA_START=21 /DNA_END=896 /DNA_ORIENTATION=+
MLRNCVAIVSGGASGLGAATVSHIIRHGGKALVADLPHQHDTYLRLAAEASAGAAKVSERIVGKNTVLRNASASLPVIAFAEVDVRSESMISAALDTVESVFSAPVNTCINCAGIAIQGPVLHNTSVDKDSKSDVLADFMEHLQVNAVGTFNMARMSAERMIKRKPDAEGLRGCIINTASIAAFEGQTGQVGFAASKGAVVGMTLPLANDLAQYGIRVMGIAPGIFKTPMLDHISLEEQESLAKMTPCPSRLGYPDEYAKLVISILDNHMLNGEIIRIDGALRMSKFSDSV